MWTFQASYKHNCVFLCLKFGSRSVISEEYLSLAVVNDTLKIYIDEDARVKSDLWEYISSLYKELLLYKKYNNKYDLALDKNILSRYCGSATIHIPFTNTFANSVIDGINNLKDEINSHIENKYVFVI